MNTKSFISTALLASGFAIATSINLAEPAQAFTYLFGQNSTSSNSPATGASAKVEFDFEDVTPGQVRIKLNIFNTTGEETFGSGATSSKLTGVGFDLFSGMSVVNNSFAQETGDDGNNLNTLMLNADFNPFGSLDVGIADNNNFLGGNANGALAEGKFNAVSLVVSGLQANETAENFRTRFQSAIASGELNIGARFQQVNAGAGSDKLAGGQLIPDNPPTTTPDPVPVPEPGNLLALGLAASAMVLASKRRAQPLLQTISSQV